MKIHVDRDVCLNVGCCESSAPDHFLIGDDGVLVLLDTEPSVATNEDVEAAVAGCPAQVLQLHRGHS